MADVNGVGRCCTIIDSMAPDQDSRRSIRGSSTLIPRPALPHHVADTTDRSHGRADRRNPAPRCSRSHAVSCTPGPSCRARPRRRAGRAGLCAPEAGTGGCPGANTTSAPGSRFRKLVTSAPLRAGQSMPSAQSALAGVEPALDRLSRSEPGSSSQPGEVSSEYVTSPSITRRHETIRAPR
jgi:hypothetical protein